jgi:hypothetical protein
MPCSLLELNRRFESTYYLHLKGQRMSQARNQHEEVSSLPEDRNLESSVAISDFLFRT